MTRRPIALVLAAGLALTAACSNASDDDDASATTLAPGVEEESDDGPTTSAPDAEGDAEPAGTPTTTTADEPDDDAVAGAPLDELGVVRPGVEQITVLDAEPGLDVAVIDASLVATGDDGEFVIEGSDALGGGTVDAAGSLVIRDLPGQGEVYLSADDRIFGPTTVLARDDHPEPSFFAEQRLPAPGFGYVETRDGTTLSVNVALPGPLEDGPYPTVVEYSGYTPSDPEASGFNTAFTALGYAYVGVNMRGTGCSGGSFRFFEYTQSTDGYDAIEAVAAQPWVLNNSVGMVGVSYPGISQLFVAQTQPPSLAAITPLSVLDDSYRSTLYPGGLLNTGFAVEWTQQRMDDALPAPDGQSWAADRIAAGDEECDANQAVRLQNPDLVAEIRGEEFYPDGLGDELAPRTFVDQITVPTFVAGAWQDEQTGGRFPTMLDRFTGTDHLYASLTNGLHTDSISPVVFQRLLEFLDLYVAERTPSMDVANVVAPLLASGLFGTAEFTPFENRFAGLEHADALAAFEAEPPIEVLFENGAADGLPALAPGARFVESFDSWPIPGTEPQRWFLGTAANGEPSLLDEAPVDAGEVSYRADVPEPQTFWTGNSSDLWRTDVAWSWSPPSVGDDDAIVFTSAPLTETLVMAGSGSVDLHLDADADDTDVEVTLSEVLPDGSTVYIQSGWLRASHRAIDEAESTELRPVQTHRAEDAAPLNPPGDHDLVRVELFPFAHVMRAGSQLRLSVDAPGGNRAVWVFETIADGETVSVGVGGDIASSVVLPVVPGVEVPAAAPACGSLRGQPCLPAG